MESIKLYGVISLYTQMLDMMGSLLERPVVQSIFQYNYPILVSICSKELDEAKLIFDQQLARTKTPRGPFLNKNMPPVAGMLKWCQELRDRVSSSIERLKIVNNE